MRRLIVAPGNAGIAGVAECADLDVLSRAEVLNLRRRTPSTSSSSGPEAPLAAGVSDALRDAGFLVFGPSRPRPSWRPPRPSPRRSATPAPPPRAAWARAFPMPPAARDYVTAQGGAHRGQGRRAGRRKGVTVAETWTRPMPPSTTSSTGPSATCPSSSRSSWTRGGPASSSSPDGTDCLAIAPPRTTSAWATAIPARNTGGMAPTAPPRC